MASDTLGHLTAASWAYANQGDNLTSATSAGNPTTTYSYNTTNANQLASTTTGGTTTYYAYDLSGHTIGISPYSTNYCPTTTCGTCLSYDAQGRLATVTKTSGLTVTVTYNAQGQRLTYTATGAGNNLSETFRYRGGELAQVVSTGGQNTTDTYIYGRDGTPLDLVPMQGGVTSRYW